MKPYYEDADTTLYLGDMREVLPTLRARVDAVVADPPYGETRLTWDRWPDGWPSAVPGRSLWCFGSMRMFVEYGGEFDGWRMSQDVVWEKNDGSSLAADRFRRVHEHAVHWYRGDWRSLYHEVPREERPGRSKGRVRGGASRLQHLSGMQKNTWEDTGTRLAASVIAVKNLRGTALHPTEKPLGVLLPLISYVCPPGGIVLDPFAGSGSTAVATRLSGRRSVLIEADERYCEAIASRLAQDVLPVEVHSRESP